MSPLHIILILLVYFLVLFIIAWLTSRNAHDEAFFAGNKKSPWYLVSFGMIGASLSGVTFISVPGWVITSQFSYLQMVLGYLLGYVVVALVLLPLYYRLNLTSIYTYLEQRFGSVTYKLGASLFLFSRTVGAAFRLYLMANVLQLTVFNAFGVPFWVTVVVTILLIWLYTFKGGIKTIVWTDVIQTFFMLAAVGLTIYYILNAMNLSFSGMLNAIQESKLSRIWYFDDPKGKLFFVKQFLSGAFITIVMTGLDQDMMQKNLSCKSLKDAQKNMYWYGAAFLPVNLLFLALGVLLYLFAIQNGIAIPQKHDDLFPLIATQGYLPPVVTVIFMIGLIAAAYSSADSALAALTTSFTIDILNVPKRALSKSVKEIIRKWVHVGFSILMAIVVLIFGALNNQSVISSLLTFAGYTYGPLLGLYAFGLFTRFTLHEKWVWPVVMLSPILCVILNNYSELLFFGYKMGFELLIYNGLITFMGLFIIRKK